MASALLTAVPGLRSPLTFLPRSTSRSVPASRDRRRGSTAGDGRGAFGVGTALVGTARLGTARLGTARGGAARGGAVDTQLVAPSATTYRSARPLEIDTPRDAASPLRCEAAALAGISSFSPSPALRARGLSPEPSAVWSGSPKAMASGEARAESLCGLPHAACTRETFALVIALIVLGLLL